MSVALDNAPVTGKGSLPAGVTVAGTTLTTDSGLSTKLNITGPSLRHRGLAEGQSLYSNGELRKITGFYENGDILIDTPFTVDLSGDDVVRVKNGSLIEVSWLNDSATLIGKVNGNDVLPKKGSSMRSHKGVDAISYDTNGATFLVTTTEV